ncbi:MAG: hypothetical protein EOM40_04245 [Clostridia bacterium]|nr:hypothetical protein [Clostridia bacterium]NCC44006.1 hypothetical protein [Clostridia bacterium]
MNHERDIFAVCDLEVDYAYHFMEYLSRKKNIPFEVRVFTSAATFLEFAKEHPVELLLISEKAMCREVQQQEIGQIMILSEGVVSENGIGKNMQINASGGGSGIVGSEQENEIKNDLYNGMNSEMGNSILSQQYPSIYKYQSSDKVIREALACYGEKRKGMPRLLQVQKNKTELIGIYSPVGRTMKTTFALTLGQMLARNSAVLYLNLEEYSGFEYLLGQTYEQTMGDLLYYLRQDVPNLMLRMSGMIQTMNNLDFVPPVLSPGDIQHTSLQEWLRLLQQIIDQSSYETVILDFGDGVEELYQLLEQCTRIYMPVRSDPVSQAKIKQFEDSVEKSGCSRVMDKLNKIKLPYHRTIRNGAGYLDDLIWSELGDYVKELIRN